jgi:cyclopropane fatty-acyl-phospholipid synthase-like methyltransferase
MKPYAESCEKNKEPILAVLREHFADSQRVLEIASGTGQHAVYFCRHLPHLAWQTSELRDHHAGIEAWLDEENLPNALPPLALDVNDPNWPPGQFDAVFSANSVHIMAWSSVERLFSGTQQILAKGGLLTLYGPFNYDGQFTSESNARFDAWLKARDPNSGVRDFEALDVLAKGQGLTLEHDISMPNNNRTLIWRQAR